MSETLSSAPLALDVGDFALRFRISSRGDLFFPRKCVEGVEAVYIVEIAGEQATWTNGRKDRNGAAYRHKCNLRELIPLRALEFQEPAREQTTPQFQAGNGCAMRH